MAKPTPQRVSNSMTVTVDGEPREIFMSFNKLNKCAFLVGEVENCQMILSNPQMRGAILPILLAEKGSKPVDMDDVEISAEDAQALLEFAAEHVTDFMLGALEKAVVLLEKNKNRSTKLMEKVFALTPITNGSGDSTPQKSTV